MANARAHAVVVARHVEGRTCGLLGELRVNVLLLNLDLDRQMGCPNARLLRPPGLTRAGAEEPGRAPYEPCPF